MARHSTKLYANVDLDRPQTRWQNFFASILPSTWTSLFGSWYFLSCYASQKCLIFEAFTSRLLVPYHVPSDSQSYKPIVLGRHELHSSNAQTPHFTLVCKSAAARHRAMDGGHLRPAHQRNRRRPRLPRPGARPPSFLQR